MNWGPLLGLLAKTRLYYGLCLGPLFMETYEWELVLKSFLHGSEMVSASICLHSLFARSCGERCTTSRA